MKPLKTCKSKVREVRFGVPQGSILEPQLFIIFTNDVDSNQENTKSVLYVDDTVIRTCTQTKIVHSEHQAALNKTAQLLKQNKFTLNADKTKTLVFSKSNWKNSNPQTVN